MYLTKYKIKVDVGNRNALNDILDGHQLHRSIQSMAHASREDSKILFLRNFNSQNPFESYVYVYSEYKLDCNHEHFDEIFSRPQQTEYINGTCLSFMVECNPVTEIAGKRRFIKAPEKRREWLNRHADRGGFRLLSCEEIASGGVYVKRGSQSFSFPCVRFSGYLEVTDTDKFQEVLRNGIGKEKAYGMGMLLVV